MNKSLNEMMVSYDDIEEALSVADKVFTDEEIPSDIKTFVALSGTDLVNVEVRKNETEVYCFTYRREAEFIQGCLFDTESKTAKAVDWKKDENVRLGVLLALGAISNAVESCNVEEAINSDVVGVKLQPSGAMKLLQHSQIAVSYALTGDEQTFGNVDSVAYGDSVRSSSAKLKFKKSEQELFYTFGEGVEGHDKVKKELPKTWIPVRETVMAAKNIYHFREMKEAGRGFRNILVRGVPGCGKSYSMGTVLAQMLGLPLSVINLKKGMIAEDLMNSITPNLDSGSEGSLPTVDDIYFDKCAAYKTITGKEAAEDITEREVTDALIKKASSMGKNDSISYKLIERPLMKVFENGGLLLINEIAAVDSDLLMSLASALEEGIIDDPVTGRTIKRHPKCVIVMTYNPATLSSHGVDEAIKSRCAGSYYEFLTPTAETFKKQIMRRGEYEVDIVDKCISCFFKMKEILRDDMDTSGNLGARELYAWIDLAHLWEDAILTSEQSVIVPATEDEEEAEKLRDVVQNIFAA